MSDYTDPTKIAAYLGSTFTTDQVTVAESIASAITEWIDHRTGRTWQDVTGSVVGELATVSGEVIFLAYVPVDAITKLELRPRGGGGTAPWVELRPDEYALTDPLTGRVEIPGAGNNEDARADYTNLVTDPPSDIAMAATIIGAYFMTSSLHPGTAGLSSVSVGQNDIALAFATGAAAAQRVDLVMAGRIVDSYRRWVVA